MGLLYLKSKEYELAKQAFLASQNLNPSSNVAWLGIAVLNENIGGNEGLQRAMASFEHACFLDPSVRFKK